MSRKRLAAREGQALTQTALRTKILLVTQPLVVTLRTLRPAVTHVVRVKTDLGVQTTVVPRALRVITVLLVLAALAVVVAVTARVHRQADSQRSGTAVMGVRTRGIGAQFMVGEVALSVKVNNHGWNDWLVSWLRLHLVKGVWVVEYLIRIVQAVSDQVATVIIRYTLAVAAGERIFARRVDAERLIRPIPTVRPKVTEQSVMDERLATVAAKLWKGTHNIVVSLGTCEETGSCGLWKGTCGETGSYGQLCLCDLW
jgi:hypothetical protein